uniref:Uncharacterized protein n=1 Tax=uncultured marine virus TaxID=186617 RepID=S4TFD2_9VIRU|nr:hypothetical protein [uncultured marine virus]
MGTTLKQNGKLTAAGRAELAKGKKRSSSKKAKRDPAVLHLRYEVTNSGTAGTETSHFICLAKDLSMVNRRLYRQGRDYHVKKISIVSSNTPNSGNRISASVIPGGWVSRQAWKRGFNVWRKMDRNASANLSGDILGTWSDFKVYMTNDMRGGTKLTPIDNGGTAYLQDEWRYTDFVSPDGTTSSDSFEIYMMGNHNGVPGAWNAVSLIKSYGESRATVSPGDPNVPSVASDDPLVNIFDDGTQVDEVINLMEASNDFPPYSIAEYPGGQLSGPKPIIVGDTTIVDGRATIGGFHALCGLIELETKSALASDTFSVLVELAPGSYRGVSADVI